MNHKQLVIQALVSKGYGVENAEELYAKHIDVAEVNEGELTPKQIADQLEEQDFQRYGEE